MKAVIILGSSASNGNTKKVVDVLTSKTGFECIDLNDYNFSYFDYTHTNQVDDFIPLMEKIIKEYELIIFATPIYWYSMSGIMKTFFDRVSDLLKIRKELGRQLRGKSMAAISCSGHDDQGEYFWKPFEMSADYLGMKYLGNIHTVVEKQGITDVSIERIDQFVKKLK